MKLKRAILFILVGIMRVLRDLVDVPPKVWLPIEVNLPHTWVSLDHCGEKSGRQGIAELEVIADLD